MKGYLRIERICKDIYEYKGYVRIFKDIYEERICKDIYEYKGY